MVRFYRMGLVVVCTLAVALWALAPLLWASIRLDGTQIQTNSGTVQTPTNEKSSPSVAPSTVIFTLGQAVMAQGALPGLRSDKDATMPGAMPARIGLGYGYNHLYHAFCLCDCHADPKCDGRTDVVDVVLAVNVASRGAVITDADCVNPDRTDVDCSGATDVLDVVKMINVAFRAGNPATEFCHPCVP